MALEGGRRVLPPDITQMPRRRKLQGGARPPPYAPDAGLRHTYDPKPAATSESIAAGLASVGIELRPGKPAGGKARGSKPSPLHALVNARGAEYTGTHATPTEGPPVTRPSLGSNRPRHDAGGELKRPTRKRVNSYGNADPNAFSALLASGHAEAMRDTGGRRQGRKRAVAKRRNQPRATAGSRASFDDGASVASTASVAVSVSNALDGDGDGPARYSSADRRERGDDTASVGSRSSRGSRASSRRLGTAAATRQLSHRIMSRALDLREAFKRFPHDEDGTVSSETLRRELCGSGSFQATPAQVDSLIAAADPQGVGQVSFAMFARALGGDTEGLSLAVPERSSQKPRGKGDHSHVDPQTWVPTRKGVAGLHSTAARSARDPAQTGAGAPSFALPANHHEVRGIGEASPLKGRAARDELRRDSGLSGLEASRRAPTTDQFLSARDKRNRTVRRKLQQRLVQLYGSQPNRARKFFLKCPRSSDGSTSIAGLCSAIKGAGVLDVTDSDVAGLVQAAREAAAVSGGAKDPKRTASRVSYAEFVAAVEQLDSSIEAAERRARAAGAASPQSGSLATPQAAPGAARVAWSDGAAEAAGGGHREADVVDSVVEHTCAKVRDELAMHGEKPSQLYLRVDLDRDGVLTHEEFLGGLGKIGVTLTGHEETNLLKAIDPRHTGAVHYRKLCEVLFPPDHDSSRAHMQPDTPATSGSKRARVRRHSRRMTAASVPYTLVSGLPDTVAVGHSTIGRDRSGSRIGTGGDGVYLPPPRDERDPLVAADGDDGLGISGSSRKHFRSQGEKPGHSVAYVPLDIDGHPVTVIARSHEGEAVNVEDMEAAVHNRKVFKDVVSKLEQRSQTARRLFLHLDDNHDGHISRSELRKGLEGIGVTIGESDHCTISEGDFDVVVRGISDDNNLITYRSFARGFKLDDPLPEDGDGRRALTEEHRSKSLQSDHRPIHTYQPPTDAPTAPGQGVPRHTRDSAAVHAAIVGSGADHATEAVTGHVSEVVAHARLTDKMFARHKSAREVFLRLDHDSNGRVRASSLRAALARGGITASQAQVDAFLAPVTREAESRGGSSKDLRLDFNEFVRLSRPRPAASSVASKAPAVSGVVARQLAWATPRSGAAAVGPSAQQQRSPAEGLGRFGSTATPAATQSDGDAGIGPGARGVAFALRISDSDRGPEKEAAAEFEDIPAAGTLPITVNRRKLVKPAVDSFRGEHVRELLRADERVPQRDSALPARAHHTPALRGAGVRPVDSAGSIISEDAGSEVTKQLSYAAHTTSNPSPSKVLRPSKAPMDVAGIAADAARQALGPSRTTPHSRQRRGSAARSVDPVAAPAAGVTTEAVDTAPPSRRKPLTSRPDSGVLSNFAYPSSPTASRALNK